MAAQHVAHMECFSWDQTKDQTRQTRNEKQVVVEKNSREEKRIDLQLGLLESRLVLEELKQSRALGIIIPFFVLRERFFAVHGHRAV